MIVRLFVLNKVFKLICSFKLKNNLVLPFFKALCVIINNKYLFYMM